MRKGEQAIRILENQGIKLVGDWKLFKLRVATMWLGSLIAAYGLGATFKAPADKWEAGSVVVMGLLYAIYGYVRRGKGLFP